MLRGRLPCVPHLADAEVAHALRGLARADKLSPDAAAALLRRWQAWTLGRYPITGLLPRVWELRHNLTAYDASFVALAEALDVPVLTGDWRLATAPGVRCPIEVMPA